MNKKLFWFLSTCFMFSFAAKAQKTNTIFNASHKEFTYSGRTEKLNDSTETFISSAAHVVFKTKSDSITFLIGAKGETHSYVVIELNGNYFGRFL